MARDLSPQWKRSRRERYSLFEDDKWKKRPTFPGEHPTSMSRPSAYSVRFREKQKVKRIYGLLEKQFRRFFKIASKSKDNTGIKFLQLLEMRLDNVIYRLALAPTRNAARQVVNHGHVTVNGKKIDVPSAVVKVGDEIRIKENKAKKEFVKILQDQSKARKVPSWLEKLTHGGKVKSEPTRDMIDPGINEQLIIEYYSR